MVSTLSSPRFSAGSPLVSTTGAALSAEPPSLAAQASLCPSCESSQKGNCPRAIFEAFQDDAKGAAARTFALFQQRQNFTSPSDATWAAMSSTFSMSTRLVGSSGGTVLMATLGWL